MTLILEHRFISTVHLTEIRVRKETELWVGLEGVSGLS